MAQDRQTQGTGDEEDRQESLAEKLARRGYETLRGKATMMRDVGFGALTGRISDKAANTYCRVNREVRHDLLAGQKIGDRIPLFDKGTDVTRSASVENDQTEEDLEALEQQALDALERIQRAKEARKKREK